MKAPPPALVRRPQTASRALPRSGTAAAVELVRIEFERARHRRELERLRRRAAVALEALEALEDRAAALCEIIGEDRAGGRP